MDEEDSEILEGFLKSFIMGGADSGSKVDQIDFILALKSLPEKVDTSNL
jgi:hypothetical protein